MHKASARAGVKTSVRAVAYVCVVLSTLGLFLAGLNVYDYHYSPDLPFREGDLWRLVTRNLGLSAVCGGVALILVWYDRTTKT